MKPIMVFCDCPDTGCLSFLLWGRDQPFEDHRGLNLKNRPENNQEAKCRHQSEEIWSQSTLGSEKPNSMNRCIYSGSAQPVWRTWAETVLIVKNWVDILWMSELPIVCALSALIFKWAVEITVTSFSDKSSTLLG